MKHTYKTLTLLLAVAMSFSFAFKNNKSFIPPGTVEVNDTLFFDAEEISNFSWQEYVAWNKKVYGLNSEQYKRSFPDTTVWRQANTYNEPYVSYYYQHIAYRYYPVVGISYEQAVDYCKWRTKWVNTLLMVKSGKLRADSMYTNIEPEIKYEYRLPSKYEWESMSLLGFSNKAKKRMKKEKVMFNYVNTGSWGAGSDVTCPTNAYYENTLGMYNLLGNVAEMISTKGICKGGSWRHTQEESNPVNDMAYSGQNAWLGFRCVCVVKKSPAN